MRFDYRLEKIGTLDNLVSKMVLQYGIINESLSVYGIIYLIAKPIKFYYSVAGVVLSALF